MKYCKNCEIKYHNNLEKCLLCNNVLTNDNDLINENYPVYSHKKNFNKVFLKITLIVNIISILTTSFIDYYTNKKLTFSLIVISANIYLILFVYILLHRARFIYRLIFLLFLSLFLIISIGKFTKNIHWAIDYVTPFMLITNTLILQIVLISKRKRWQDYTMFLIISSFINISLIIVSILKLNVVYWPTITSFLFGIVSLTGLIILFPKPLKEEFLRRFHI